MSRKTLQITVLLELNHLLSKLPHLLAPITSLEILLKRECAKTAAEELKKNTMFPEKMLRNGASFQLKLLLNAGTTLKMIGKALINALSVLTLKLKKETLMIWEKLPAGVLTNLRMTTKRDFK